MFLIRDWNTPNQYTYGEGGGKKFLERKLELKEGQSGSAKVVRELLRKCFEEVNCFLMPKIGDKAEEHDFNGSVEGLTDKFVDKMKEFISGLLNPEDLKPKTIDNIAITGAEAVQYFKTYVDIFNSDELPNPTDMVEATAKAGDMIKINKLKVCSINSNNPLNKLMIYSKDSHSSQLQVLLNSKPFVARKELKGQHTDLCKEASDNFNGMKKSTNSDIIKELETLLSSHIKSNYDQIYLENERNRDQFIAKASNKSRTDFENTIEGLLDSTFMDPDIFEEELSKFKRNALKVFVQSFGDEEEELFSNDLLKVFSLTLDKFLIDIF